MNKLKLHLFHPPKPPPPHSTKSFNATINRLSSEGLHKDVLHTYASMLKTSTPPDAYTFPSLLKACSSLNLLSHGLSIHQRILVNGYSPDPYNGSSLIHFYAKLGHTHIARQVFDTMPDRKNVVPWTAIIGCYARTGDIKTAVCIYNEMLYEGIRPSSVTMLGLLCGVLEIKHVQCVHACVVCYGFGSDLAVVNSILDVYGKCGGVEDARILFEMMERRDVVSWNSLVSGYALVGNVGEILDLMRRMRVEDVNFDQQTIGSLVSAIARQGDLEIGQLVHAWILTAGFELDAHVETSLIVLYSKCGKIDDAFQLFERTLNKDVIQWTAMISGLVQNKCADKALTLFQHMLLSGIKPPIATIASALAACGQLGSLLLGTSIHAYILRQRMALDITAQNSLVTMYVKCDRLVQSQAVFDTMEKRDVVSWNAIVAGYTQNGNLYKSFCLFNEMRTTLKRPDSLTIVSLLQACALIGALHQGKWVHNFVIRSFHGPCTMIDSALVDMYCKCGDLDIARKCFDRMSYHDLVPWSTMIAGYGSHGKGEMALTMYDKFLLTGLEPNHVIFLSVLCACNHNGLVNQGLNVFYSMRNDYRVEPKLEHLSCIVDLLSRAGRVKHAYIFYKRMFQEPEVSVLGIILDACRMSGNLELGNIIARDMCMSKPMDARNYLQVAQSYASMERWDGVREAWTQMRSLGLIKLPGWSFVDLNGSITTFLTHHASHPQHEDIVQLLNFLSKEMRDLGANFRTDILNIR